MEKGDYGFKVRHIVACTMCNEMKMFGANYRTNWL